MRGEEGVFKVLGSPRWERDTALAWWPEPRLEGPKTQPKHVIFEKNSIWVSKKILSGRARMGTAAGTVLCVSHTFLSDFARCAAPRRLQTGPSIPLESIF